MRRFWLNFLRLFFRLLYHEFAWSYDLVAWLVSLGHWKAWGRTALRHVSGTQILELGHGPGHLLVALQRRGYDPVGLDLSVNMGRQARRRLDRAGRSVPLVRAQAQALPFRDECFDTVVATFPTRFIMDLRTLRDVTRTLGAKGRLVVALGTRFEGKGLIASFLSWLYRVTGQAEPSPSAFEPWLGEVGLSPRIVRERVRQTTVLLIVAEKRQ
jgi:ubiquinone/menaquinone biosynthesis C-methylase UbiE